jgi:hypothetical protein
MSLQRLYGLDRWSTQFSGQLDKHLHSKEYADEVQRLSGDELAELVDYLNSVRRALARKPNPTYRPPQVLDRLDSTSNSFRKCLHELQAICHSKRSSQRPTNWLGLGWSGCQRARVWRIQ